MKYNIKWKCGTCGFVNKWKWDEFDFDMAKKLSKNRPMYCEKCHEKSIIDFELNTKGNKKWLESMK